MGRVPGAVHGKAQTPLGANDSCIQILKNNFASNGRVLCNGRFLPVFIYSGYKNFCKKS